MGYNKATKASYTGSDPFRQGVFCYPNGELKLFFVDLRTPSSSPPPRPITISLAAHARAR